MKFCPECNNLLYIIETDKLYHKCKNCGFENEFKGSIILTRKYKKTEYKNSNVEQYLIHDPSYVHTIYQSCPNDKCESKKDVSLQDAIILSEGNNLEATYICTVCLHKWMY
jgi:DNA-directed RNA polymerase subunit M/transcription elongation factor TFIIS